MVAVLCSLIVEAPEGAPDGRDVKILFAAEPDPGAPPIVEFDEARWVDCAGRPVRTRMDPATEAWARAWLNLHPEDAAEAAAEQMEWL